MDENFKRLLNRTIVLERIIVKLVTAQELNKKEERIVKSLLD